MFQQNERNSILVVRFDIQKALSIEIRTLSKLNSISRRNTISEETLRLEKKSISKNDLLLEINAVVKINYMFKGNSISNLILTARPLQICGNEWQ